MLLCFYIRPPEFNLARFTAGPQDRTHLEAEIRKAHVICVVYSVDNPQSFDRIPTFWLPHFRQLGVNVPVILVGNKIDLRGGEVTNEALEEEIVPIMNEFKVLVLLLIIRALTKAFLGISGS